MQLGNAAWGFRETPVEEQLRITNEMGLDLLELSIGGHENDFLQLDAGNRDIFKVKRLFRKYNVKMLYASTGNDFTQENRDACIKSMENIKRTIDIAESLGIEKLRIFAGFSPVDEIVDERWNVMLKMLNEVAKYGHKHGVLPAIETHGGVEEYLDGIRHFHSTTTVCEKLIKLFDELEYPTEIVFDPANLGAVGLDESKIIALYNQLHLKISYFHLKDFALTAQGALKPCACGEGQLDWKKLMDGFASFSGPGLIEYELPEDIEDGLKRSLKFLNQNGVK